MTFPRVIDGRELMDAVDLPASTYVDVVGDLAKVNRVTMAARPTIAFLERCAAQRDHLRVLDVGFGDGDMLRTIARWAARTGTSVELVGIDLNARSLLAARGHGDADGIDYRIGDYADLAGNGWDAVISSLVAHHMTHGELVAFLRFMEAEARVGWLVNDLHRHRVAQLGFRAMAAVAGWHPIVRHDGALSVARAFTPREWLPVLADAGILHARVFRAFPFRLCVERLR